MKPKESAECHQTLSSRVGSGHETTGDEATAYVLIANEGGVASEHVHLMICYCLQNLMEKPNAVFPARDGPA